MILGQSCISYQRYSHIKIDINPFIVEAEEKDEKEC